MIATNVGGIPEMVEGTSNLLVPPDDAAALEAQMRAKLQQPEKTREAAAELHEAVRRRFTARAMTEQVLAFYRSA